MQDDSGRVWPNDDEEYTLPTVEALMAGTMALMTGYAQTAVAGPQRPLMARKLVSNLLFLAEHPQVSPPMRCMLANLRTRWQLEAEQCAARAAPCDSAPLWQHAPALVH